MPNYKQETLVAQILQRSYNAHNAVADVQMLKQLMETVPITKDQLIKHGYSVRWALQSIAVKDLNDVNVTSLQPLVAEKYLSAYMAMKIGQHGLCLDDLKLLHDRGGSEAVYMSLSSENGSGVPRISKCRRIATKLCQYFES
jgi:hypothetical protein